jgi:hypothetical protein
MPRQRRAMTREAAMVERPGPPHGADLDRALRDLAPRLAYPPTPDVARAVRTRLAVGAAPRRSWRAGVWSWPAPRRLALAALLLLALAVGALLAVPGTRRAIAGYLGVPGIQIISVTATPVPTATATPLPTATALPAASTPVLPTATASPTPRPPTSTVTPTPSLIGCPAADATPGATPTASVRLCLGQPMSLADARARVAFPVRVPALAGFAQPDEVYVGVPPAGGQVSFVYFARPDLPAAPETSVGLLITQFRGQLELDPAYAKKFVTGQTQIDFPLVNGVQGYWLSGAPHEFVYRDANGNTTIERVRLAGNVLLWSENGVTYRIEGARTEAEALAIAASLR